LPKKVVSPASARSASGPLLDPEGQAFPEWSPAPARAAPAEAFRDLTDDAAAATRDIELLLREVPLEPADKILVLDCGAGRHVLELARRGFQTVGGIEATSALVRQARSRARQAGFKIDFQTGDIASLSTPAAEWDAVLWLGDRLGRFETAEQLQAYLEQAGRLLRAGGTLILDLVERDWVRQHFEPRAWDWIDQQQVVCREQSLSPDGERLLCRQLILHTKKGVLADQFQSTRLYTADQVLTLLERSGFSTAYSHGGLPASDSAPADAGVALSAAAGPTARDVRSAPHRILISACPLRDGVASAPCRPRFPEVAVLLGDAFLPDETKRGGVFNPDDVELVDRLKAALLQLKEYRFRFFERHETMIQQLRLEPPQFVLNLCDEGYRNLPTMELHVPALLEMLGIPYSGAGPACLALCYDKHVTSAVAVNLGIPVPSEVYCPGDDFSRSVEAVFPAIVKPNCGDGSFAITQESVVHSQAELQAYLEKFRQRWPGRSVVIQELLTGPEYTIALLGNPGAPMHVLPIVESDFSGLDPQLPKICGFESKDVLEGPYSMQIEYPEAQLDPATRNCLIDYSERLFARLGCRDYARFDFRLDAKGAIKLLDANPNPGYNYLSYMAEFEGMDYASVMRIIIQAAQNRTRPAHAASAWTL
jgi:D-alanine-D-alanine ligase